MIKIITTKEYMGKMFYRWTEDDMGRKSQNITNFEHRVSVMIALLIAPLVTRSFSKSFWVEIQEEGFSIKCNWAI